MIRILAKLPSYRGNPGVLTLEENGVDTFTCACLGKADNGAAIHSGNPTRDPTLEDGDTPTGLYAPTRPTPIAPSDPNYPHMGAWFFPLNGVSGDAARAKSNGRKGLAIHGGRGDDRLVPTHGCLRLRDVDMTNLILTLAGRAVDEVAIDETPTNA